MVTGGWRVKSQKPETTSSLRSNGIRAGPSRDKQNGSQALQAIEPTLPVGKDEQPVEEGVQQAVGSGEAMGWGGTVLRRDRDGGEGAEGVSGSCLMKARGLRGAELCDDPGGISESTEPPEEGDSEAQEATAARRPTGMPAKPEELNAGGSSDSTELPEEEDLVEEVSSKEPPGRTDEHNAEKPEAEGRWRSLACFPFSQCLC